MRSNTDTHSEEAEKAVRDIRRATRRQFAAEEKVRIVIAGPRGEDSIAPMPSVLAVTLVDSPALGDSHLLSVPSALRCSKLHRSLRIGYALGCTRGTEALIAGLRLDSMS